MTDSVVVPGIFSIVVASAVAKGHYDTGSSDTRLSVRFLAAIRRRIRTGCIRPLS